MVRSKDEIRGHLALLKRECKARAERWGYASDAGMPDGWGLTKYDCGLILASLGQFFGYKVFGKADWGAVLLSGQVSPSVDGGEKRISYSGRPRATADYTWFDGDRCVGVFETDGRDNRRALHLPEADPVAIRPHNGTNNLYKLSIPVLRAKFGYVPRCRAWILFQVDNPNPQMQFVAKGGWKCSPEGWRSAFHQCADLDDATMLADTELFGDLFVDYIAPEAARIDSPSP
jgi:hypothetical protein